MLAAPPGDDALREVEFGREVVKQKAAPQLLNDLSAAIARLEADAATARL